MSNVVIVSSEPLEGLPAGGISTFIRHFAVLLLERGERLTWLIADPSGQSMRPTRVDLQDLGVEVVAVQPQRRTQAVFGPRLPFLACSAAIAERIPQDADVVYFQDWGGQGFATVRRRRLLGRPACPVVSVMHGASEWVRWGMQLHPRDLEHDATLSFVERYAVEHADLVAAPGDAMRRWLIDRGWRLPPERTAVLGYPVSHRPAGSALAVRAERFRRLVYFGRLQTVKGLELFVEAVQRLAASRALSTIDEVVLLGGEARNRIGSAADVIRLLERSGVATRALTRFDSTAAQGFLAEHSPDSLVIVPSLIENFPYTVIEASLVPALNLLCSKVGGVPEILAGNPRQLFEPHADSLAEAIAQRLRSGPLGQDELTSYDVDEANERWLAFHERALASPGSASSPAALRAAASSSRDRVDVCVVHRDDPRLDQLLLSLERQTCAGFGVTVVDDGSTEESALTRFASLESRYAERGWRFVCREHDGLGTARNAAAGWGTAELLLFVGASDVLAPTCIERLVSAATRSQTHCLSMHVAVVEGGEYPLNVAGNPTVRVLEVVEPPGGPLATALVSNPYGLSTCLVRRDVFVSVGGYAGDRWVGREEYELYVRLALARLDIDVVPETLVYHRRRSAPAADAFRSHERILRAFREPLAPIGLAELPDSVCGLSPPVAPDVDSPDALARTASFAGLRLGSAPGWAAAEALAATSSWPVLAGSLVLKACGRRARA